MSETGIIIDVAHPATRRCASKPCIDRARCSPTCAPSFATPPPLPKAKGEGGAATHTATTTTTMQELCSRPDPRGGERLPLHCIGLNRSLILLSSGDPEQSSARVERFILREVLPSHPVSIIKEDDAGRAPFVEVVIDWVRARRAV